MKKILLLAAIATMAVVAGGWFSPRNGIKSSSWFSAQNGLWSSGADGLGFGFTDPGGGGQMHASAYSLTDPNEIMIGGDISGAWITYDHGASWEPANEGLTRFIPGDPTTYVDDLVAVPGGYVAATHIGLFRWTSATKTWARIGTKLSYTRELSLGATTFSYPIPFSAIAWDGGDLLIAGAGRTRCEAETSTLFNNTYPNVTGAAGDSAICVNSYVNGTAIHASGTCYSLWQFNLSTSTDWSPVYGGGNFGAVRDVDVDVADGDTTIVACSGGALMAYSTGDGWCNLEGNGYVVNGGFVPAVTYSATAAGFSPWSLFLVRHNTMYVGFDQRGTPAKANISGAYRYLDVTNDSEVGYYVGHPTNPCTNLGIALPAAGYGATQTGTYGGRVDGRFVSLVGSGATADTLLISGRIGRCGVIRAISDYAPGTAHDDTTEAIVYHGTDETKGTGYNNAWLNIWGSTQTMPAAVSPLNHSRICINTSARMEVTTTGSAPFGIAWTDSTIIGGRTYWRGRGWNEMQVLAIDNLTDGRLVVGNADEGVFISDPSGQYWEMWPVTTEATGSNTAGKAWNIECRDLVVNRDYDGLGHDAIIAILGDSNSPSKVLYLTDDDGDGNWTWGAVSTLNANYMYKNVCNVSAGVILAAVQTYTTTAPGGTKGVQVHRFTYDGLGAWDRVRLNNGSLPTALVFTEVAYSAARNKMFVSSIAYGDSGGVYRCTLGDSAWTRVINKTTTTNRRDIGTMRLSASGSGMYIGTNGPQLSGYAQLLYTENPCAPTPTWTELFNSSDATALPVQVPEYTVGWGMTSSWTSSRRSIQPRNIRLSPTDSTVVYFGITGPSNASHYGVWKLSGSTLTKLSGPYGYGVESVHVYGDFVYYGTCCGGLFREKK